MTAFPADLLSEIRHRFAHVDTCPFQGERIFFENAGGALTLKSVVETSATFAAIPDNPGRINPAGATLADIIERGRGDVRAWFNADGGKVIVGESGTELIFRLMRAACLDAGGGVVFGTTLEHPATRSAAQKWADRTGMSHQVAPHDAETGTISAAHYDGIGSDARIATVVHTSPVSGMGTDLAAISRTIRAASPGCIIIVDGIQHAAHGVIDVTEADVDAYVISPYKAFSRHGYGVAWVSDRLAALPHDHLADAPGAPWELGTRDAGAYAATSDVVAYLDWLGGEVSGESARRGRIVAAARAMHSHEAALVDACIHGVGNLAGLSQLPGVSILGGIDNPLREGLVSFTLEGVPAEDVVARLNDARIRTHTRKADHYSANVLDPLGLEACVRVSFAHYNSIDEVAAFLNAIRPIAEDAVR